MIDKAKKYLLPLFMALFLFQRLTGCYSDYQTRLLRCKLEQEISAEADKEPVLIDSLQEKR